MRKLRKNEVEVPPSFIAKGFGEGTSRFGFDQEKTLVFYTSRKNIVVLY